ncbi:9444_t:CDS:2 [Diversispora eburnea]|uniref:9444_t:CDS:1 n=1 Tax=Diversispora eburnea TaxID=1213867 RepID=A0A9N9FU75_9GLOM|nr:9444_t:CDS:2 [Diversispora eburnea]
MNCLKSFITFPYYYFFENSLLKSEQNFGEEFKPILPKDSLNNKRKLIQLEDKLKEFSPETERIDRIDRIGKVTSLSTLSTLPTITTHSDESKFDSPNNNFTPKKVKFSQTNMILTIHSELDWEGEFSTAYKVKEIKTKISYAVKKRKTPFKSHIERIENLEEVEIMWKLENHPNCIQLFSAWEQQAYNIKLGNLSQLRFSYKSREIILLSKSMVKFNPNERPNIQKVVNIVKEKKLCD